MKDFIFSAALTTSSSELIVLNFLVKTEESLILSRQKFNDAEETLAKIELDLNQNPLKVHFLLKY